MSEGNAARTFAGSVGASRLNGPNTRHSLGNVISPFTERADGWAFVLSIALHAASAAGVDDVLDDLAVEVHQALTSDSTLAGLAARLELIEDNTELEREAKVPHGKLTMRWGALVGLDPSDPETIRP